MIKVSFKIHLAALHLLIFTQCHTQDPTANESRYVFFLHNRFTELFDPGVVNPDYGCRSEYFEILNKFKESGFTVISEKRPADTDVKFYAKKIVVQIDSLLKLGAMPDHISVIGTSKGGYIAEYVSTYLQNPNVNFVFIGSYQEHDLQELSDIQYCGNILSIYEKTDSFGVSAIKRKETSTLRIPHFKEIELNTNLRHGFLYRALDEWLQPSIQWANGNYGY